MPNTTQATYTLTETGLRQQVYAVAVLLVQERGVKHPGYQSALISVMDVARVIAVHPITVEDVERQMETLADLGSLERRGAGRYRMVVDSI